MRLIDADRMKQNTPNWLLETDGMRKRMLYDELDFQPTISETEIIRKAFERVVERLEEKEEQFYDAYTVEDERSFGQYIAMKLAVDMVKEEGGIE